MAVFQISVISFSELIMLPLGVHYVEKEIAIAIPFVKGCNLYLLNGHVTTDYDNHTRVSNRGKSAVDVIALPHDCINF